MLIGLFYNKIFRQKLSISWSRFRILAADNTRVPLYMLMVAVHKELGSDDVPDGKIDIISRRGSSRVVESDGRCYECH
ncbi:ADI_G0014810.mRNA.1.CDS.1 [Saccharomyces cerevisiae]|nr:ADI_G0014810.mRNA.1.CDS.1 [Saccharomyces cerevisiae]CAI6631323.1 ADI_G0014810.mRNA.1.CDS.1 [Saccharomyces cerevisiae]